LFRGSDGFSQNYHYLNKKEDIQIILYNLVLGEAKK